MNECLTVRSEESAIYTRSRNPTVQIYVGTSDVDLGTSDVERKYCSRKVKNTTQRQRRDFRLTSELLTVGTSDAAVSRASRWA
jgi:hypothetical protein